MANEATINASLQIRKGNLLYRSQPASFRADVSGTKGPVPGAILVSTDGVDVDFSELTNPGLCRLQNLSATYRILYGVREPDTSLSYLPFQLLPGEVAIVRFSEFLQEEVQGTGTGTGTPNATFRLKSVGGEAVAVVEAFEE